ncbi:MAG: zinc metalloprotease HtpX [Roseiflexus sp.]
MGKNVIKLFALMAALTALFLIIGNALGGAFGLVIAVIFAAVINLGAYWFSDSIVLRMAGAREASREEAPWLYQMVEQLSARAGLPVPRVYIIDEDVPNAFATGRSPSKGVVAVTTGISRLLTKEELAGVIAHELAHIKNRDTLISAVTATISGAIAGIADMWMWSQIFNMFGGGDDEEGGNPIGELLLVIIAPIAATLIQLGISRAREFQADELGARILGDPLPLASALEKIEWAAQRGFMQTNPATASLYIVNPLSGAGGMMRWFSTHPPTEERIARLRAMARQGRGRGALAA